MEAAIAEVRERLGATGALIHPLGILSIAAWIGTHDAVPSAPVGRPAVRHAGGARGSDRDRRTRARHRADSARATTRPSQARRVAELAGRPPGTITRYSRVALAAIATADLDQARTFVQRELRGLAGDDDLTARLAATLRTYLDEHSSRSRTAKRLGIHENTVSYRIKQAEEILGRSVDQRTLELRVALALAHLVRDRRS